MILYNVTTKVLPHIHDEWLHWMQTSHVPDVMKTGYFKSYKMCKLDKVEEDDVHLRLRHVALTDARHAERWASVARHVRVAISRSTAVFFLQAVCAGPREALG
jgi:hypothetical protein